MTSFTPFTALIGGMIIGLAAAVLLIGNGDIMGASGIVNSLFINLIGNLSLPVSPQSNSKERNYSEYKYWESLFIVTFGLSANIIEAVRHTGIVEKFISPSTTVLIMHPNFGVNDTYVSVLGYLLGGFFTGFGTKLSNGCTSGHGICGMARFSFRSTVAVCCFMGTGIFTASFFDPDTFPMFRFMRATYPMIDPNCFSRLIALAVIFILFISSTKIFKDDSIEDDDKEATMNEISSLQPSSGTSKEEVRALSRQKILATVFSAALFAVGLAISSMINNCKIIDFLDVSLIPRGSWDPSLVFVMGGGLIISALSYQIIHGYNFVLPHDKVLSSPINCTGKNFNIPQAQSIDKALVLGSMIFGFGWGIGGLCPGPAAYQVLIGQPQLMFLYTPAFIVGTKLATITKL